MYASLFVGDSVYQQLIFYSYLIKQNFFFVYFHKKSYLIVVVVQCTCIEYVLWN